MPPSSPRPWAQGDGELTHVKRAVRLRPAQSKTLNIRKQETGMK